MKYFLWAGIALLLQLLIFRHLRLLGSEPDVVLVFLLYVMANSDRTTSIYIAAFTGFILDIFLDLWGINLIAKVATAFLAYHFIPKIVETKLLVSQIFLIILLTALFHNLIFVGIAFFVQSRLDLLFWNYLIGNAIFTSVIGSFTYLFKST
ncbi:MAG: rod shape-determining protein MreD [Balneolales bacterium]